MDGYYFQGHEQVQENKGKAALEMEEEKNAQREKEKALPQKEGKAVVLLFLNACFFFIQRSLI
ncbi:MAG: hypothetical protein QT03_C0001G0199 [archaeon GW2011_AR10]|nr:MAG: hypothetical protein QT03_C0001G0199 [archaeon GW2011_AR10]